MPDPGAVQAALGGAAPRSPLTHRPVGAPDRRARPRADDGLVGPPRERRAHAGTRRARRRRARGTVRRRVGGALQRRVTRGVRGHARGVGQARHRPGRVHRPRADGVRDAAPEQRRRARSRARDRGARLGAMGPRGRRPQRWSWASAAATNLPSWRATRPRRHSKAWRSTCARGPRKTRACASRAATAVRSGSSP